MGEAEGKVWVFRACLLVIGLLYAGGHHVCLLLRGGRCEKLLDAVLAGRVLLALRLSGNGASFSFADRSGTIIKRSHGESVTHTRAMNIPSRIIS